MQVDLVAETAPRLRHEAYIARRVNLSQVDAIAEIQNHMHIPRRPASIGGAFRDRHGRGRRDAVDALAHQTKVLEADGEAVWSRRPDAGAK